MTLTSLIVTNAVLAAVLVYVLVHFLTHGIHADRRLHGIRRTQLSAPPAHEQERIAA